MDFSTVEDDLGIKTTGKFLRPRGTGTFHHKEPHKPGVLSYNCTPGETTVWFQRWRMGFKSASVHPTDTHRQQLANIVRSHLDEGWESELKVSNIGIDPTLESIELVITNHLKITCPDIQRLMSLFNLPHHMEQETHAELLN